MFLHLYISFTFETNFNCYTPEQISSIGYGLELLKEPENKSTNIYCFPQNLENLKKFQCAISDGIEKLPDGIIKLTKAEEMKNTLNCDEILRRFKEFEEDNEDCGGDQKITYENVNLGQETNYQPQINSVESQNENQEIGNTNPTNCDINYEVLEGLKSYGYLPDQNGYVTLTVTEGDCEKEILYNIHKNLQNDSMPQVTIGECEEDSDNKENMEVEMSGC